MRGGLLAALAIPDPPVASAVAANPAATAAVRRACVSFRVLDMAPLSSQRGRISAAPLPWGEFWAAPVPMGQAEGRPDDEADLGPPQSMGQPKKAPLGKADAWPPQSRRGKFRAAPLPNEAVPAAPLPGKASPNFDLSGT